MGGARLQVVADVSAAIDSPAARTLDELRGALGLGEELVLLATVEEPGRDREVARAARAWRDALLADPLFHAAPRPRLGLPELAALGPRLGPLYAAPDELARGLEPAALEARIEATLARADLPGLGAADQLLEVDPLGLCGPLLARLGAGGMPPEAVRLAPDGRAALATAATRYSSSDPVGVRAVVEAARRHSERLSGEPWARGIALHLAGGHALAYDGEQRVRRDLVLSLSSSLLLSVALVAIGLRIGPLGALLLGLPVAWGAGVGLGLHGFVAPGGQVPALALACAGVLVGIGIDFTIHGVGAAGHPPIDWPALARRLALAAATTVAAFAAFATASQPALRAMGQIAALGVAACWLVAWLVMPALLAGPLRPTGPPRSLGVPALARWARDAPRRALGAAALVTLAALVAIGAAPPGLETDLSRLHAPDAPPIAAQREVLRRFGTAAQPVLIAVRGGSPAELLAHCRALERPLDALRRAGRIGGYLSPSLLLPADQPAALAALARLDAPAVAAAARDALVAAGWEPAAAEAHAAALREGLARRTPLGPAELDALALGGLMRALLAPDLALVLLFPGRPLWDQRERAALDVALRAALHEAGARGAWTGMHFIAAEAAGLFAADFLRVSGLTLAAVLVVLGVRFRHPGRVALVLVPAGLAAVWTAGLLAASGIRLNMMNLGVLPMVLAIGVDDGIHVVDHWLAERDILRVMERAGTALALTSLTTMVSFGSLGCSSFPGLASVGWLTLFGLGAALAATVLVLPALLGLREVAR